MFRLVLIGLFSASLLLGNPLTLSTPQEAEAGKKKNRDRNNRNRNNARRAHEYQRKVIQQQISGVKAQVAQAERVLAAAKQIVPALQKQLAGVEGSIDSLQREYEDAKTELTSASEDRESIEGDIEASQDRGSSFAVAKQAYLDAKTTYVKAIDRVLSSKDFKTKYERAKTTPDGRQRLLSIRNEALAGDPEFAVAKRDFEAAEDRYTRLRNQLYYADPRWNSASAAAQEAQARVSKAMARLKSARINRAALTGKLRDAIRQGQAAQLLVARGQAALKNLESASKRLSSQIKNYNRNRYRRNR